MKKRAQIEANVGDKKLSIVVEGENTVELFEEVADIQGVFFEDECPYCESKDLICKVFRTKEGKKFYTIKCTNRKCNAELSFGVKDGRLFTSRKEGENGWTIYRKEDQ